MVDIIHRISIKAPLPKVYAALSTVEDVAGWWTKETSGVSKPGGAVQVVFRSAAGDELGKMELEVASRRRTRRPFEPRPTRPSTTCSRRSGR